MKCRYILQYVVCLVGIVILISACAGAPKQETQVHSTPVVSPMASAIQLKPEGAVPSSCPVTPVYQYGPKNEFVTSEIPWVAVQPSSSGIVGHLFYSSYSLAKEGEYRFLHAGGSYPDGSTTKILWTVDHSNHLDKIQIDGTNLSHPTMTFHQTIGPASSSLFISSPSQYPSLVVVPDAGCWRLHVTSGEAGGTLIMWVAGDS